MNDALIHLSLPVALDLWASLEEASAGSPPQRINAPLGIRMDAIVALCELFMARRKRDVMYQRNTNTIVVFGPARVTLALTPEGDAPSEGVVVDAREVLVRWIRGPMHDGWGKQELRYHSDDLAVLEEPAVTWEGRRERAGSQGIGDARWPYPLRATTEAEALAAMASLFPGDLEWFGHNPARAFSVRPMSGSRP